jgi:hypothetical protein
MSRYGYQSSFEYVGDARDPDIVYYNASIINNTTDDLGGVNAGYDPPIRFNETRDTAIVKDASRYQFSIVRFVMNGANKDLPLFIPAIQSYTGQTDPDLTEYGFGMTFEGTQGATTVNIAPDITYVEYESETQNPVLAPLPRSTANANYVGVWNPALQYVVGNVVALTGALDVYYQVVGVGFDPTLLPAIGVNPATPNSGWTAFSAEAGAPQDLSTRYYWVYTYSHWVDLVNTAFINANEAIYNANPAFFATAGYATLAAYLVAFPSPKMKYDETTQLFTIYTPPDFRSPQTVGTTTGCFRTLYFNVNSEGLFANFNNIFLNQPSHPAPYSWINPVAPAVLYPTGYANLLIVNSVGLDENIITAAPYTGWVAMTQNYLSVSTLWSPIDSIVFTSTLLPLQNEATAPPNALGTKNTGNSAATSQSAFTPIITDVALDLSTDGAAYRKMIYYAPAAEYRMADFQNSKQDIRNIDIQVFWKNRLDNQLYPVSMFNLSSVSFKLMFRKKTQYTSGYGK